MSSVLGIIENMSYFIGEDGKRYEIFRHGGGKKLANEAGVPYLGDVPIDPKVAECGDGGEPIVRKYPDSPAAKAYVQLASIVVQSIGSLGSRRRCRAGVVSSAIAASRERQRRQRPRRQRPQSVEESTR